MVGATDEKAFKQGIEKHLTGTTIEFLQESGITEQPTTYH